VATVDPRDRVYMASTPLSAQALLKKPVLSSLRSLWFKSLFVPSLFPFGIPVRMSFPYSYAIFSPSSL
jgi:hypothetical protein